MKWLGLFAAIVACAARADSIADYGTLAHIRAYDPDGPHRIELPFEAYRDMKLDAGDLRVFNAAGESLPIALAAEPETVKDPPEPVALPIFSYKNLGQLLSQGVKRQPDGTIISVQGRVAGQSVPESYAYVIDASHVTWPIGAFEVDWDSTPPVDVTFVYVFATDNLVTLDRVAVLEPLVDLLRNGVKVERRRVEFPTPIRANYFLLGGGRTGFQVRSIRAIPFTRTVLPAPRRTLSIPAMSGSKPGVFEYDLGARLPVEAFRMPLPMEAVLPFKISTRESNSGPWVPLMSATYFRFKHENPIVQSDSTEIERRFVRQMRFEFDAGAPGAITGAPPIVVQWRPSVLVFVAGGARPFTLAFNNRDAKRKIVPPAELIPNYAMGTEKGIPQDKIVSVVSVDRPAAEPDDLMHKAMSAARQHKGLMWGVIVLGLGWLAWRWRSS